MYKEYHGYTAYNVHNKRKNKILRIYWAQKVYLKFCPIANFYIYAPARKCIKLLKFSYLGMYHEQEITVIYVTIKAVFL